MTTYAASIEWLCDHVGVIRLHPSPSAKLGDPFVWSACVVRSGDRGDVAYFKGAMEAPPIESMGAIHAALRSAGFARREHARIKGRVARIVSRKL